MILRAKQDSLKINNLIKKYYWDLAKNMLQYDRQNLRENKNKWRQNGNKTRKY